MATGVRDIERGYYLGIAGAVALDTVIGMTATAGLPLFDSKVSGYSIPFTSIPPSCR